MFSSLTWFLPDSGIDSKQDKGDWGSIKLTQRRKRADLGVQGVSKGRIQKSQEKKNLKTVDWAKEQGGNQD